MKIDRLETHDRYQHFLKDQSEAVSEGAEECLKRNPYSLRLQGKSPYIYVYGHARTHENGVDKRIIWDPRLSKPNPEPNSFLFRAQSFTDVMEVCWVIPDKEFFPQFKKGNVIEDSDIVQWSINQYLHNRKELARPFPEDFTEDRVRAILFQIAQELEEQARMNKLKSAIRRELETS
jgi:hypothetical protein